jgi:hypothetical protein
MSCFLDNIPNSNPELGFGHRRKQQQRFVLASQKKESS